MIESNLFTIKNRVFPEVKKTFNEFLDEIIINNDTGQNLIYASPRWVMAQHEDEDDASFKDRCIINPSFFQTPGIVRDQEEALYSDADPIGHLKLVGMLAKDFVNANNLNNTGLLRAYSVVDKEDLPKLLTLASLFHDYHEGDAEVGDKIKKDKEFKLKELITTYRTTLYDIKKEYEKLALANGDDNKVLKDIENKNKLFDRVFLVLLSDPKLEEKYGISLEDVVSYFKDNGEGDISNLIKPLKKEKNTYKETAEILERLHQLSFLMAALSMKERELEDKSIDYDTRALKFEACARSLSALYKILGEQRDNYCPIFLLNNTSNISDVLRTGRDIKVQLSLAKNGRDIINPDIFLSE